MTLPPRPPAAEFKPKGRRHTRAARPARRAPPLRRVQRLLPAVPGRVDDLQLRDLLARRHHARGGPGGQARPGVHQARPPAGHADRGHRQRLGRVRHPRREELRRARHGHHRVAEPGRRGDRERRARGRGRQGRLPRPGLPRPDRRDLRRGGQHRHGRARRRGAHRRVHAQAGLAGRPRRPGAQPRHRAAAPQRPRRRRLLRALRVPRRRPDPRVAHHRLVRARGHAPAARRGLPHGLRRDAAPLGRALRLQPGGGRAPGRRRARARVAPVPARRPQRLRDRLHRALPGARAQAGLPDRCAR